MTYNQSDTVKKSSPAMVSQVDIYVLDMIKQITGKGENAEVRQSKDGSLAVYEVKKSKRI